MQKKKKNKESPAAAAANVREEKIKSETSISAPFDLDDEGNDDDLNCDSCPLTEQCAHGKIQFCVVRDAKKQDVDWFISFWNEQRLVYGARLRKLTIITGKQKGMLRRRQARYGKEALRQFVINLMTSDFANCRDGMQHPSNLEFYLHCKRFPKTVQGEYNNLAPEDRPLTEQERRKQAEEERQREAEERRRKNNEIDQQIREEQRRAREEAHANRATPEQLEEIFKNFRLPPLKNGLSPNPSPVREGSSDPRDCPSPNPSRVREGSSNPRETK